MKIVCLKEECREEKREASWLREYGQYSWCMGKDKKGMEFLYLDGHQGNERYVELIGCTARG